MRQSGDEIDVDVGDADRATMIDVGGGLCARVQPAHSSGFFVNERLDAEADAIDAGCNQSLDNLSPQRCRRAFNCDFGFWLQFKIISHGAEDLLQLVRTQRAGSATTEIDRIS